MCVTFVSSGKLSPTIVNKFVYPCFWKSLRLYLCHCPQGAETVVLFLPLEACGSVVLTYKEIKCFTDRGDV